MLDFWILSQKETPDENYARDQDRDNSLKKMFEIAMQKTPNHKFFSTIS